MKNQLIKLFSLLLLATVTLSCKKEYDDNNLDPLAPSFADIPVTVTNANVFERFPVIFATAPAGAFSITFSIPQDKGTIKEITRVATGSIAVLQSTNPSLAYNLDGTTVKAIPGNGTNTITFNSTLADYATYRTRVGANAGLLLTAAATPQVPIQLNYFFVLTLATPQGDIQVVPPAVRVRVIQ